MTPLESPHTLTQDATTPSTAALLSNPGGTAAASNVIPSLKSTGDASLRLAVNNASLRKGSPQQIADAMIRAMLGDNGLLTAPVALAPNLSSVQPPVATGPD